MRIVHVVDTFAPLMGGIEAQVARLAGRQAAAGHDVEVITTTPRAPGERGVTTAVERLGPAGAGSGVEEPVVTVHRIAARIPGGWPIHPRSTTHVVRRLRELAASGARPDVVHLHMGVLAPTVQAALRPVTRLGLPTVLTVHSVWGAAWRAFAAADAIAGWSRWPVLWSAVSELTAAPLRRIVGDRGEVVVLPNGLDLAEWRVADFRSDRLHVASAARFAPRKRMLPLLSAIARAHDELSAGARGAGHDRLRVTLAGDGAELGRARRFVVERGLSGVVSLPGALDADGLRALYADAHVFAAPALTEAFGIAALEAQAAGLVVLARAGSGLAERVSDGVDGLIVPDDDALASTLVRLATDHDLRRRLLDGSRDASRLAAYDWPGVLAATEQAYARAAELAGAR
ncbi:glycosyltransferase family 4 protein [Myceligenerans pegani]|uniref:D-inositol 3-phosphate glycosyltransferase n=1 Tax=Myceligenerans pegani TaxID=2776917 RepID=A0ABR9MTS5_9MICO|nr:glycosyltransferase [Myceligenerans sp. TRM 65318]MBE1874359.1 glycosyltransferase [Myceligenerans sp. TRM 65318]MBE3016630.1 glycosyltransferase [Myceligenerans sp. TRM 65318]